MKTKDLMHKNFNIVLVLITTLFAGNFAWGQTVKYSNEFMAIGVGARAFGMSKATVATVKDATAGYWNPAGLTQLKKDYSIGLMHSEYFAGIAKYDYASLAIKLDEESSLGFSYIRFGVDDIPNTINLIDKNGNVNYNNITSFSAVDNGFLLSYARKTGVEGLSIGLNGKIIYRKIGDFAQAWGFGIDLAGQYEVKKWKFGLVLRDATSTFNAWSYSLDQNTIDVFKQTGNEIPENGLEITLPRIVGGIGREFEIKKFYVLPEVNFEMTFDGQRNTLIQGDPVSIDPFMGLEVSYNHLVFIRGGIGNFQRVKAEVGNHKETSFQPNIGVGLNIKGVQIDYALTDVGDNSTALYSNVFSLTIDLNKFKK